MKRASRRARAEGQRMTRLSAATARALNLPAATEPAASVRAAMQHNEAVKARAVDFARTKHEERVAKFRADCDAALAAARTEAPKAKRRLKPARVRREPVPGQLRGDEGPEAREQIRLVAVLEAAGLVYQHCPSGGKRSAREADELGRMGHRKGFPDIQVLTPPPARPGCPGVVVEMKAPERRPVRPVSPPWAPAHFSTAQKGWLERLQGLGWAVRVAYTAEEAVEQLRALGYEVGPAGKESGALVGLGT